MPCHLRAKQSSGRFFTNKDGSEQFFVRDGPRTVTLKADDRLEYLECRWPRRGPTIARAGCRRPVRTAGFPPSVAEQRRVPPTLRAVVDAAPIDSTEHRPSARRGARPIGT